MKTKNTIKKKTNRYKTRGVSRIDQEEKHNHGFYVRIRRNNNTLAKFFSDKKHGGKEKAFVAAQKGYRKMVKEVNLLS